MEACEDERQRPLIRPSGTFSREGRRVPTARLRLQKAPSPGSLKRADLSPEGEMVRGRGIGRPLPLPWGRGRRVAPGEGALHG